MTRHHVFDNHLEVANRWLVEISESLQLSPDEEGRAVHALRAGLHAIRDRLPANEVLDLGAQLPTLIRGIYFEGWRLENDPARIRDRAAMISRVQKELAPDPRLVPVEVLRAVIHLLVEHVSPGEIGDVVATLPKPIASLWNELMGHSIELPRSAVSRSTGYHR